MTHLPYGEACRWDYPGIRRGRSLPAPPKLSLPRKDSALHELGKGLMIDEPDGAVCVQVWDRADWSLDYHARRYGAADLFWVRVYDGWVFPGEFRLLRTYANGDVGLGRDRYNSDGHRAHADGTSCYGYPCSGCPSASPEGT